MRAGVAGLAAQQAESLQQEVAAAVRTQTAAMARRLAEAERQRRELEERVQALEGSNSPSVLDASTETVRRHR